MTMEKASLEPYTCGLEAALVLVGGKWKCLILWNLSKGTLRYSELRRAVTGISEKMLAEELRIMESYAIVVRSAYDEQVPRVEYSLSPFGEALYGALKPVCEFGWNNRSQIAELEKEWLRKKQVSERSSGFCES